jgi:hypothetical protein
MFNIEDSIPQIGRISTLVETARIDNFAKEFENAIGLFGREDMFRHLCFDEPMKIQILRLKSVVSSLDRTKDAKKKKNMVGYLYVCFQEMGYLMFKLGEMPSAKFYEYARLALEYRAEEWIQIDAGENVKVIVSEMEVKRNAVEDARKDMEDAIF